MAHVNSRVQKHRDALRAAGLRPVQLWVPDTRRPGYLEECARESQLIAEADARDSNLAQFLEAAATDIDGWIA